MKNDLSCAVVRDLLPNYIEGLTSEETNCAVQSHLDGCPDCSGLMAAMREPESQPQTEAREVDFLKTVRRRNFRRIVLAVTCTLALLLTGFALKLFVIGTPVQHQSLTWELTEYSAENTLFLHIETPESASAFHSWNIDVHDGFAFITARRVLVSPLFQNGSAQLELSLDGIETIYLAGKLI